MLYNTLDIRLGEILDVIGNLTWIYLLKKLRLNYKIICKNNLTSLIIIIMGVCDKYEVTSIDLYISDILAVN